MNPKTEASESSPSRKPVLSLFFATACGAGYLPKAPGTWGSLLGVAIYFVLNSAWLLLAGLGVDLAVAIPKYGSPQAFAKAFWFLTLHFDAVLGVLIAFAGVITAHRVAKWTEKKDPQFVVVDEVSGQFFTYLFALAPANWKYLLLGFILFRVFDIWKPFPVRQAESLPGGWGIMADDWMAAVYAAIGIWIARAMGL
ncbi:MAG TPA: phosphatidylglycerophosphatase A [Candidatus Acidoferrales bacterium]|nr:phosphatidylglycerophosphatase A [Candidatus Acidoferrales bacterium]